MMQTKYIHNIIIMAFLKLRKRQNDGMSEKMMAQMPGIHPIRENTVTVSLNRSYLQYLVIVFESTKCYNIVKI